MSTVDRRIGWLQRKRHRCAIGLRTSPPINRSILETETEQKNDARGQKMRVASRVTSEHGLACSAFGVRPPSLGFVLSNGLCVHTCPTFRYIYISYTVNVCTRSQPLARLTRKPSFIRETSCAQLKSDITRVSIHLFPNLVSHALKNV